jgi:DNA-binding IclR family transcriptional regulator
MPPETPAPGERSNASEKTLLVLSAVLNHPRFTDVVEATGLAKATVHRILSTLVDRGYVAVGPTGQYLPGPTILSLAGRALQQIDISAIAQPIVDELVAQVQCTVHVGVANGDEIIYLIRADSDKPYQMPSRVGLAIPMHSSGIGKVVLSGYTEEGLARYAARTAQRTPVRDHTGTIKYGLSISTLKLEHTVEEVAAMAPYAIEAADKISAALGHTPQALE